MTSDPILVHACCAPCLCALLEPLAQRGLAPTVYFYNPNIHPFIEFRRRMKAVQVLADQTRIPLVVDDAYGLAAFLDATGQAREAPERCRVCYTMRLGATARHAADHGFPAFTTTLLASPQQDRGTLCTLGHAAADRHGVRFDDTDWRGRHDAGLEEASRRQLYRQQYCGCIFSEHERYRDTARHLYQPSKPPTR